MKYYAAIAALALLTACQPQPPAEAPAQESTPAETEKAQNPALSQELYDKIENGMTLEQVEEILGPGTELSETAIAGLPVTEVYMWSEDFGAKNLTITLQDGIVTSKTKVGF